MSSGGSFRRPERGNAHSKKPPARTGGFLVFPADQFSGVVWMAGADGVTAGAGAVGAGVTTVEGEAL